MKARASITKRHMIAITHNEGDNNNLGTGAGACLVWSLCYEHYFPDSDERNTQTMLCACVGLHNCLTSDVNGGRQQSYIPRGL